MALAIGDTFAFDFDFPEFSTTTTTDGSSWNNFVDWEAISGGHDEFQGLIDSLMSDDTEMGLEEPCNSASIDLTMTADEEVTEADADGGDCKGLRLIHLLTAAAEALSGETKSHHLARVILIRLKEIVSLDSITEGTNMKRLGTHFTEALQGLLDGKHHRGAVAHHDPMGCIAAVQLIQNMSPYANFGHFTANQAILEAAIHYKRVHVVDYDIMEGTQWAPLMQALVSHKDSPPAPHLRITALSRTGFGNRSIWTTTVQETGRRLAAFAESIGLSFSFHHCRLESDETFNPSALKIIKGEALVFNLMLHLSNFTPRSSGSIGSFLCGAKTLNPRVITLVEEEVGFRDRDGGFVGRFMDSLHHYSAIYDSLECGFPIQGQAWDLVERFFLGPKIAGTLDRIYRTGGEDDTGSWTDRFGSVGFEPVKISLSNHCQAKLLLGLFNDGYRVEELANNRLVLSWKSRRLLSASLWTSSSDDDDSESDL